MPPGVVREILRPPVGLPLPEHIERAVIEQGDPARAVRSVGTAQAGHEHPVRSTVQGVRSGVTRLGGEIGSLHDFGHGGLTRVGLGVEHVQGRRADARHDEVSACQPRHIVALVLQRAATGVPTEMMQFVAQPGYLGPAHHPAVGVRVGIHVDHAHGVGFVRRTIERDHVGQSLRWGGGRVCRGPIEGRVCDRLTHFQPPSSRRPHESEYEDRARD